MLYNENLPPAPFLQGFEVGAERWLAQSPLPSRLAALAQRVVEILRIDAPDFVREVYGTPLYMEALRALTYDPWIRNMMLNEKGELVERQIELAIPTGATLRDDTPRLTMLTEDTQLYRSAKAANLPEEAYLAGGALRFMYRGWIVESVAVARRSERPDWLLYRRREAERLGLITDTDMLGQRPELVHVAMYQYLVGLPHGVTLEALAKDGRALPSPLRYGLGEHPEMIRSAYKFATPSSLQNPSVREAIEAFVEQAA